MSNTVVRTNVMSLNSHRNLGAVGTQQARSSARLSSGFRINSAADDAAGLAISEKMRSQIRGLNQASRNAQDGISLIQTAEGAMQTINDMVTRIRELVIQASNDTNVHDENTPASLAQSDRVQIQREIGQLLAEIDDVTVRTEFNTRTLLDGTWAAGNAAGTEGSGLTQAQHDALAAIITANGAHIDTITNSQDRFAPDTFDGTTGERIPGAAIRGNIGQAQDALAELREGQSAVRAAELRFEQNAFRAEMATRINEILDMARAEHGELNVDIANAWIYAMVEGATNEFFGDPTASGAGDDLNAFITHGVFRTDQESIIDGYVRDAAVAAANILDTDGMAASSFVDIDTASGSSTWAASFDQPITDAIVALADVAAAVELARTALENALAAASGGTGPTNARNATAGTAATTTLVAGIGDGTGSVVQQNAFLNALEFTATGTGAASTTGTFAAPAAWGSLYTDLGFATAAAAETWVANNQAAIAAARGITPGSDATEGTAGVPVLEGVTVDQLLAVAGGAEAGGGSAGGGGNSLWFHVGANTGQGISLNIEAVNTRTMGINTINVEGEFGREIQDQQIEALDYALAHITGQRAILGAVQNRLEFTIDNLNVASENLSAANSRIRDTDMAAEMMRLTQSNVLQQAAISMLSQANMAPQSILQLLG